jgi:hypothetical protein
LACIRIGVDRQRPSLNRDTVRSQGGFRDPAGFIFLATLAIRQQTQRITFDSAAQMLDTFAMQQGGTQYRRLMLSSGSSEPPSSSALTHNVNGAAVVHRALASFASLHKSANPIKSG